MGGGEIDMSSEVKDPSSLNNITVVTEASPQKVLRGVTSQVDIAINVVSSRKADCDVRPPIHLCIVLDNSGSMNGNPLDTCKEAIKNVVTSLKSTDRLSLVTYSSEAQVVFGFDQLNPQHHREEIFEKVSSIHTDGMTNLYSGLKTGFKLFEDSGSPASHRKKISMRMDGLLHKQQGRNDPGAIRRIFLLSDGQVNTGITSRTKINDLARSVFSANIQIDSFGISKDFDEDLMQDIGEHGGGRFFYIERVRVAAETMQHAMRGLLGIVGRNATLDIKGMNGGMLRKLYDARSDKPFRRQLGDLTEENERISVARIELAVPSLKKDKRGIESMEFVGYTLRYQPVVDGKVQSEVTVTGTVAVTPTESCEEMEMSERITVQSMVAIQEAGELGQQVEKLMSDGKRQKALSRKQEQVDILHAALDKDGENKMLKAQVVAQDRLLEGMKDSKKSKRMLMKANKKNDYMARRLSITMCMDDMAYNEDAEDFSDSCGSDSDENDDYGSDFDDDVFDDTLSKNNNASATSKKPMLNLIKPRGAYNRRLS